MKINEKTLISYCTSNTPSDREGWLVKRGEVNKAFQRRWCVLKGNLLFYSEKQTDKEPVGVIILEGCTVELAEEETDVYAFKVLLTIDYGTIYGITYVDVFSTRHDHFHCRLCSMAMARHQEESTPSAPTAWRTWRPG